MFEAAEMVVVSLFKRTFRQADIVHAVGAVGSSDRRLVNNAGG